MSLKNFTKGLLFGSLIGASGGLLFAPRKGSQMRENLRNQIEDTLDNAEQISESVQNIKAAANEVRDGLENLLAPAIQGIEKDITDFQFQVEPRISQLQEQLEKIEKELPQKDK
ncbi:MAG: YtxH domain-containing protein [Lactobacillales bacterium]|jgi:gas vesicle protein|nr:YtxH domain-containing protein [Lactobacillales bacterium]